MNLKTYKGLVYNEATYMMRQPIRRSVQGLSKHNVYIFGLKGNPVTETGRTNPLPFDGNIFNGDSVKPFEAMLSNRYPSMLEVASVFSDKSVASQAFHRKWAVQRDEVGPFEVMYKNTKVGYTENLYRFVVSDRYRFLKNDLKELDLKVA